VPGCGELIDSTRLMCRHDWYRLPKPLRDRVWATWRSGTRASSVQHQQAVRRAIAVAHVARSRGLRRQWLRLRNLSEIAVV
jgi:hypothetical protein